MFVTNARVNQLLMEVKTELTGVIPFRYSQNFVEINRSKQSLGICRQDRFGMFTILISKYALNCTDKEIKDILAHELIHTCERCFDHDNLFQYYMNKVNKILNMNVTIKSKLQNFKPSYKYKMVCEKCGLTIYRNRVVNKGIGYTHESDGGKIITTRLY